MSKKIIHCDCDCFYAAIEMRDDPRLATLPIAIGGSPEQRGVIATCNYLARAFGVHSAMSSAKALRLCPDLLILRPSFNKYHEASEQILDIYKRYTPLVEPLSLDEAYLDVSDSNEHYQGSATRIAEALRQRVKNEIGITISAGVGPNKFLAKIASDWNKPDGLFVIRPEDVADFMQSLPVKKLWGVGTVTAKRLEQLKIYTCQDLQARSMAFLMQHFGRQGANLYELSRGIDRREVETEHDRKSISVENTFNQDLLSGDACLLALDALMTELESRIKKTHPRPDIQKLFIKLRFHDFSRTSAECLSSGLDKQKAIELIKRAYDRHNKPVRLVGVGVRVGPPVPQLPLFVDE